MAFWIAMSGFFLASPTDTWTNGDLAYRVMTAVVVLSPLLLVMGLIVQKVTFTQSGIERVTRLGRTLFYPYDSVRSLSNANDALLQINFTDGRTLKVHSGFGNVSKIMSILRTKTGKGVGASAF